MANKKIKAIWGTEYDYKSDECYSCPMCPDCMAPIFKDDENEKYRCISCGSEMEVDREMKNWIDLREGTKEEITTCMKCGEETMHIYYYKNHNTTKWETGSGCCEKCGMRFIV